MSYLAAIVSATRASASHLRTAQRHGRDVSDLRAAIARNLDQLGRGSPEARRAASAERARLMAALVVASRKCAMAEAKHRAARRLASMPL